MKARTFVPRKLDVGAFIESGEVLSGESAVADLPRLAEGMAPGTDASTVAAVRWKAQGRQVAQRMSAPQLWLDLSASVVLPLECQRCLHPVAELVEFERSIRFAKDEETAAQLDADSDDDVLALARNFDLLELIEDELIMAQPIVPRHDECPTDVAALMNDETETPVPGRPAEPEATEEVPLDKSGKPNPFAVLAALKKGGK